MRKILSKTHRDGTTITYYLSEDGRIVTSEIEYSRLSKSLYEELEERNKGLPKTKRQYMTDEGKVVGYLTAKKLGIIS
jgi:hypothetical protein